MTKRYNKVPVTFGGEFLDPVLLRSLTRLSNLTVAAELREFLRSISSPWSRRLDGSSRWKVAPAPETRPVGTALGDIEVDSPRILDRDNRARSAFFDSKVFPRRLRHRPHLNAYLAWTFIEGLSTGDFTETRELLLAPARPGFPMNASRELTAMMLGEHVEHLGRRFDPESVPLVWVDSVDLNMVGVRKTWRILAACAFGSDGSLDLVASHLAKLVDTVSWTELLRRVRQAGFVDPPRLIAGAVDFNCIKAANKVWPKEAVFEPSPANAEPALRLIATPDRKFARISMNAVFDEERRRLVRIYNLGRLISEYGRKYPLAIAALAGTGAPNPIAPAAADPEGGAGLPAPAPPSGPPLPGGPEGPDHGQAGRIDEVEVIEPLGPADLEPGEAEAGRDSGGDLPTAEVLGIGEIGRIGEIGDVEVIVPLGPADPEPSGRASAGPEDEPAPEAIDGVGLFELIGSFAPPAPAQADERDPNAGGPIAEDPGACPGAASAPVCPMLKLCRKLIGFGQAGGPASAPSASGRPQGRARVRAQVRAPGRAAASADAPPPSSRPGAGKASQFDLPNSISFEELVSLMRKRAKAGL